MKLLDIGEFGLINKIAEKFKLVSDSNIHGIGDDCAVIPMNGGESLLITTDILIEDIHFIKNKISAADLGFKSLAVNLSDIAAMGGSPNCIFLSLGIPPDTELKWIDDFFDGLHALAERTEIDLLGGDTSKSDKGLIINIVVMGKCANDKIKFRYGSKAGDIICVTDFVGNSGCGLNLLLQDQENEQNKDHNFLIQAHHKPKANLAEGRWLSEFPEVHSMIDISDGVDSDITRIMESSGVGAEIYLEKLPISEPMKRTANAMNWNPFEIALTGGEDYCLICTLEKEAFSSIAKKFKEKFARDLFSIGRITKNKNIRLFYNGDEVKFNKKGFDHFNK